VGALLGERFLASSEGRIVRESLAVLPRETVFGKLVPMLGERLRQPMRVEWEATESGGLLRILGRRATPAEVTLGFFEIIARENGASLALESTTDELIVFRVGAS
jgi:hypothetical protein